MIIERKGNLLDVQKGLIIHGCNARGVMGSGVAKQVKEMYPEAYYEYLESHQLGSISFHQPNPRLAIINAVTQQFYGRDGLRYTNYEAVAQCFEQINDICIGFNMPEIHFPLIGAGLGGGNWNIISTIIDETIDASIQKTLWKL